MTSHSAWWELPGPSAFVESLTSALCAGRNVVLALPRHYPAGMADAVDACLREADRPILRRLNAAEDGERAEPEDMLRAALTTDPHILGSGLSDLCSAVDFQGHVVWVDGLRDENWTKWRAFVARYAAVSRQRAEAERTALCLPIAAVLVSLDVPTDVTLDARGWGEAVDLLDVTLYLSRRVIAGRTAPVLRRVHIAVAAELAGPDPDLADRLAEVELDAVLEPGPILEAFARDHRWASAEAAQPRWVTGMSMRWEGSEFVHSAAVWLQGDYGEIRRRIWKGQLSVLYPLLERIRVNLLPQLRPFLRFPRQGGLDLVQEIEDLELAPLAYELSRSRAPASLKDSVRCLKDMRHALAHLEPVSLFRLRSRRFLEACAVLNGG